MAKFQLFSGGRKEIKESITSATFSSKMISTNQRCVISSIRPNMSSHQTIREVRNEGGRCVITERKIISSSGVNVEPIQSGEWKTVTTKKTVTSADGKTTTTTVVSQEGGETLPEEFSKKLYVGGGPQTSKTIAPGSSKGAVPEPKRKPQSADAFAKECLEVHNNYRKKHGTPPLKLSPALCKFADEWVQKLAKEDKFQHRPNNRYGENIYMKWSSDPNYTITGTDPVESWYSEIKDHVFGREPTSLKSGHFTQVIWKGSQEMGVAQAKSKSGKILVVANYNPPGNMLGSFAENVPNLI